MSWVVTIALWGLRWRYKRNSLPLSGKAVFTRTVEDAGSYYLVLSKSLHDASLRDPTAVGGCPSGFDCEPPRHSEWSKAESNCVVAPQAESRRRFAQDDTRRFHGQVLIETRHYKIFGSIIVFPRGRPYKIRCPFLAAFSLRGMMTTVGVVSAEMLLASMIAAVVVLYFLAISQSESVGAG